ncbi:MAG: FtsW/RodA/SpoVE family cell cycle protein, partial [Endomicrobiia bacterium]
VLIIGKTIRGSRAWIDFGWFTFQPSEITKVLFVLALAGFLDKNSKELYKWQQLILPILMLFGNVGLILLQPDFSSTLVYFPVFLVMLYCAGANILHLYSLIFYGLISISIPLLRTLLVPILKKNSFLFGVLDYKIELLYLVLLTGLFLFLLWWFLKRWKIEIPIFYFIFVYILFISGIFSSYFVGKSIKEHQRKRLVVFINPKVDPLGSGYNIIQSKIAVGSGKIFGKGLFNGTQAQLGFLPAQHTDFIFSLISEEMGFVFSIIMIILYGLFLWRIVNIAYTSRDRYGSLVACGFGAMFAFYIIVNIGMVVGLMPITGLPLPFVSYGGSSLISSLICLGILLSINIRRFMY